MKFLSYFVDGIPKKAALKKDVSLLGRDNSCDIVIEKDFVSSIHLEIRRTDSGITVIDKKSKNGLLVKDFKVGRAELVENESFRIGYISFYFKEGDSSEFIISEDSKVLLNRISKISNDSTKQGLNMFDKALIYIYELGLKINNINSIVKRAGLPLKSILKNGSVFLLEKNEDGYLIRAEQGFVNPVVDGEKIILQLSDIDELFEKKKINHKIGKDYLLNSFPLDCKSLNAVFVYLLKGQNKLLGKRLQFLDDFVIELSFLADYIDSNRGQSKKSPDIITENIEMLKILKKSKRIAKSDISILIQGETGTGKELFAKFIHYYSDRVKDKYIAINCSAIPEKLLEDELFGHEKGAFTGAITKRIGKLENASGGTLILDEIGDMPIELQTKLLRVLQEQEFYRVGGNIPIKVSLRIISMTNKNIREMIGNGEFREDLFFRIGQFIVNIPPLRDRKDDIIPLVNFFIERISKEQNKNCGGFTKGAIDYLQKYNWAGNVRQLENTINLIMSLINPYETVDENLIKEELQIESDNETKSLTENDYERGKNELIEVLKKNQWHKTRAAEELKISRTALYKRMKKYGLK